jgi:hypothetical protein
VFAIEVRAARDSDVEAIAAIYVDAAREGWADFLGESNMDALQPRSLGSERSSVLPTRVSRCSWQNAADG